MSEQHINEDFGKYIENKLSRLSFLLKNYNHFWAAELTQQIIARLDKISISISEKLHIFNQLILTWEDFLRTLLPHFFENWPFIYNAYNQIFHILLFIKDYGRITENGLRLTKNLIKIQYANHDQIANVLDSLAMITIKGKDLRRTIEILYLTIFFRGTYLKTEHFDNCFSVLDALLQKLAPGQRTIVLFCFLNNAFRSFYDIPNNEDPEETNKLSPSIVTFETFVDVIYRASINSVAGALGDGLSQIKRSFTRMKDFNATLDDLKDTIKSLQMVNEHSWAFTIVMQYVDKLKALNLEKDTQSFLNEFIENSFKKGAYPITFQAFQYLVKLFTPSSNPFNPEITRIWANAAKKFRVLTDKSYFVACLEELKKYLVIPQEYRQFQDYSFAINEYYRLKRGFITPTEEEFWWAALHRSIFEEGFEDIANLSARKLKILNLPIISQLILKQIPETMKIIKEEQQTSPELEIGGMTPQKIMISLRIPTQKTIKLFNHLIYRPDFTEEQVLEIDECWDDPTLTRLYQELPTQIDGKMATSGVLSQSEFGKLAYIMLPKEIRKFNNQLKIRGNIPELFAIMDQPNIPLELIQDGNTPFAVKYGIGYRFKEPKLSHNFQQLTQNLLTHQSDPNKKLKILAVGDLNTEIPKSWDDKAQKSKPMFIYQESSEILNVLKAKVHDLSYKVEKLDSVSHLNGNRDAIEKIITTGQFQILYFASNLFFLEKNPIESYFITPDNQSLSLRDLFEMLSYAKDHNKIQKIPYIRPLIVFGGRVIDQNYSVIHRSFDAFSHISQYVETKYILGILARISTDWNPYLEEMNGVFLERIILGESVGAALITAHRQLFIKTKALQNDPKMHDLLQILGETHIAFFGEPWGYLDG